MKIQCDVCDNAGASVFCTADEAALCDACDHRVHHANKLASKHQRFSLLHPSSAKQFPLCDVCQEKRAFLFCQQDRAILCGDCDVPIHTANEHTQKHNRFFLTGVELSATAAVYTPSSGDSVLDLKSEPINKKPVPVLPVISNPSPFTKTPTVAAAADKAAGHDQFAISEYLMEVLPGWHVEDFLDSSSAPPFGFCKNNDGMLPFSDDSNMVTFSSESSGISVPQTPSPPMYPHQYSPQLGGQIGFKETKEIAGMKNRRWTDDAFTVPQISPPSKRSRLLW